MFKYESAINIADWKEGQYKVVKTIKTTKLHTVQYLSK